jgi:hypothetical protein
VDTNCPFQFQKRSPLFIGVHNEPFSIVAMCIGNEDRSPVRVHNRNAAPTPAGFAAIVAYDFRTVRRFQRL